MSSPESAVPSVPVPPSGRAAHSLLRWVCTSNPFYIISAALFLFGLRVSFGSQARDIDSWALMSGLTGYTLLLASAGLLLVRFARVWNDVRTVLLLVVLMFLATSVTFDELLVLDPERGQWYCVGGFVFAVALTEGLLRGIRLRLPLLFRMPYHLTLALFFLYPLLLAPLTRDPHSELLMWGLWGFAPVAGLIFLTLLPAIHRGRDYSRDNGSPWPWPFYPWSVFVFLAVAVCGRAFLLCWSFHLLPGINEQLIFGPYFLVPFGFAVAVLLLELGLVEKTRVTQWIAVAMPLVLVALSTVGHRGEPIYAEFLRHFATRLGAMPMFVALVMAGAFYLYAWTRAVQFAAEGVALVLAALAFVGPDALTLDELSAPQPAFLIAAVLVQVWVALWRHDGWRLVFGATVAIGWVGTVAWRGYRTLREEVVGLDYLLLGLVLLPVAVLISLANGGVLSRWVARWTGRTPTPTG
ncbi:MAG: hypothetical protein L0241_28315 [Planctomycetia bacterium]|nr:hypothetical protein [Planctomycetia bacterium]